MSIHLRQICLVAEKLEPVIDELTEVLGISVCHVDPGVAKYGLENALMPMDSDFLEVVAPIRDGTAAGRYLNRRGGNGGYMVIMQVDSRQTQADIRQRALAKAIRIAHEEERDGWNFCQLHPQDMIASFLDIEWDQQQDFTGCWHPAGGENWRRELTAELLGVELQSDDPVQLAALWGSILDIPVQQDENAIWLELRNAQLRFVEARDGRGAGLSGIDISLIDRASTVAAAKSRDCYVSDDQLLICGTRFYLHQLATINAPGDAPG